MSDKDELTPRQARFAMVYCLVAFAACAWLLKIILDGDWQGVVVTSAGLVVELKYFFALGALASLGAFVSMIRPAWPARRRR